jgi:16S rRNA (uracil1498-N3)-methyltransferase
MLPRLLIPLEDGLRAGIESGEPIEIGREQARYLSRVLRLSAGDPVQVFDGQGSRYGARIVQIDAGTCQLRIEQTLPRVEASRLSLTLAQCLSSADKMDWTIEKAVELGVSSIVPLFSERSLIRLDPDRGQRKLQHWQAVVEAACMQSGQDQLPALCAPVTIAKWLAMGPSPGLRLALSPFAETTLVQAIEGARLDSTRAAESPVTLLVGPESGLTPAELERLIDAGFVAVKLGPRVLRTETAGLAALAAIAAIAGDFR